MERVAPCLLSKFNILCTVHSSPLVQMPLDISLHLALPGTVSVFLPLFVIMFETNCLGPYVYFSSVFQVGFSNK